MGAGTSGHSSSSSLISKRRTDGAAVVVKGKEEAQMASTRINVVDKEAVERSHRIDKELAKARSEERKTVKLLLLGGAESGKSTFVKQMKILHMNGFTESELINYRYLIYANVATALHQILRAINEFNISPAGLSNEDRERFKTAVGSCVNNYDLTPELATLMQRIWKSKAAQECYKRRSEFDLLDSAKYFLDELQRISAPKYTPSMQDILRSRAATVGIYEINFHFKGYNFRLVDVGGQRTERRKWIHCFDNVTAIIFVTSLAEYDQTLAEDRTINRMHDSLSLFKSITSNQYFTKTSSLLFLNKKDLFMDKLRISPFTVCFPDYKGANTYEEASAFILKEFTKRKPSEKTLYSHMTVATDTKNIEVVFAAAMDTILQKTLSNVGVY